MNKDIENYNKSQTLENAIICNKLAELISENLPEAESKIWHAHPVWFLDGNPIAGYSKLKNSVRLMFWSGQSFLNTKLEASGNFKAAVMNYTAKNQINDPEIINCLEQSREIQWDYKNIVKRKGKLELIK